jgi:hypothetical protein
VFILVLLYLCAAGWIWTGRHQPPAKAVASHVVLGIAILSGMAGLVGVWRRPIGSHSQTTGFSPPRSPQG